MSPFPIVRRLTADQHDDVLIIRVVSSQMLDEQSDELRREFAAVIQEKGPKRVVLDLSQVAMISSVGVGVVISLFRRVKEQGGELVLCGLTRIVEQVFRLCRLVAGDEGEGVFQVYPCVDSAKAAVQSKI